MTLTFSVHSTQCVHIVVVCLRYHILKIIILLFFFHDFYNLSLQSLHYNAFNISTAVIGSCVTAMFCLCLRDLYCLNRCLAEYISIENKGSVIPGYITVHISCPAFLLISNLSISNFFLQISPVYCRICKAYSVLFLGMLILIKANLLMIQYKY